MERKYLASFDDVHDHGSFEFWSEHRSGSKQNFEDAKKAFVRKYGWKRFSRVEITNISRYECY